MSLNKVATSEDKVPLTLKESTDGAKLTADLQVVRRLRAGYHSLQLCPTCRLLCTKMDQNPRRDLMRASSKVTKQLS